MTPDRRNHCVRRYPCIISSNGFDPGQNFIDRFYRPAGQHFVVRNVEKFECAGQVVLGLQNSTTPILY
jgi:hypothetical protein